MDPERTLGSMVMSAPGVRRKRTQLASALGLDTQTTQSLESEASSRIDAQPA